MDTPSPLAEVPAPPAAAPAPRIAPYWHTALLVLIIASVSLMSAKGVQEMASQGAGSKYGHYIATILWLWFLFGFTYFGIRREKAVTVRQLIGGKWGSFEDVLLDFVIAAGFWAVAAFVLGFLGKLLGMTAESAGETAKTLQFLLPASAKDFAIWVLLSMSAGFCEEVVFRGYLQQQFRALAKSTVLGIVLSALLFGASHLYEGGQRMILIAVFGAMFGILAQLRRSLRPGMIAHAWHNSFVGLIFWLVPLDKLLK